MALRIKQEDLPAFVKETIQGIRDACEALRDNGIIAELPDEVAFTVEIVQSPQSLSSVVTTATTGTKTSADTRPEIVETSVKSGGGQTTTENSSDTTDSYVDKGTTDTTTTEAHVDQASTTTDTPNTTDTTTRNLTDTTNETTTNTQNATQTSTSSGGDTLTQTASYA